MNVQWHTIIIATFIVSMTVYAVSANTETGGWIYVIMLLLAASLFLKNFTSELIQISSAWGGNVFPPERAPGQNTGPF